MIRTATDSARNALVTWKMHLAGPSGRGAMFGKNTDFVGAAAFGERTQSRTS